MFGRIQKDSPDFLQITRLMSRRFKTSAVVTFRKAKMLVQLGTAYTVLDAVKSETTGHFGEIDISPNLAKALYRIVDTPRRISGEPDALALLIAVDRFDKSDRADGDQILLAVFTVAIFFHKIGDQTQISFNEDFSGLHISIFETSYVFRLLVSGKGGGK